MALANDDIWQKFDLFSEESKNCSEKLEENLSTLDNVPFFHSDNLKESSLVPDISDLLFDFGMGESPLKNEVLPNLSLQDCSNEPLGLHLGCDQIFDLPFVDLETLDSSEALRHDCMWSGHCPSEEHKVNHGLHRERGNSLTSRLELMAEPPTGHTSFPQQSVFDTPIQSDLDCSDLDETLSDIEVEDLNDNDRATSLSERSGSDHTYTTVPSLTPAPSEEEDDCCNASLKNTKRSTSNQTGKGVQIGHSTIKTRPPKKTNVINEAKFKFQVKFMPGSATHEPRSLLRHTTRPTKVQAGLKQRPRGVTRQNNFHPSSVKRLQVPGGKLVKQRQLGKEKEREVRDLHNSMERQRRVDLKNAFDALKTCVPDIAETDRASKLMILDRAADFCQELSRKESALLNEKEKEVKRNQLLQKKLSMLRTLSKMSLQKCTRKMYL